MTIYRATRRPLAATSNVATWNKKHSDVPQSKFAEIHSLAEQCPEASKCYHSAISVNLQSGMAVQGLKRLEKVIRGVDPDNEIEDEVEEMDEGEPPEEYSDLRSYGPNGCELCLVRGTTNICRKSFFLPWG